MVEVIWTEPALNDVRAIWRYYAEDSPSYADRLAGELVRSTRRLEDHPKLGRQVPEFDDENIREVIYSSYRVIYISRTDNCFVTAVIHGSRDILRQLEPGDWDVYP